MSDISTGIKGIDFKGYYADVFQKWCFPICKAFKSSYLSRADARSDLHEQRFREVNTNIEDIVLDEREHSDTAFSPTT